MRYIIVHGHLTVMHKRSVEQSELIEICAIKIDSDHNELDVFESLCNPTNEFISNRTHIITNIYFDKLKDAPCFVDLINNLKEWIGDSEDVTLITWGDYVIEQIVVLCELNSVDWSYESLDIQKGISFQFNGDKNLLSLESSLEKLDKTFIGMRGVAKLDCINILSAFKGYKESESQGYAYPVFEKTERYEDYPKYSMSQRRKMVLKNIVRKIILKNGNFVKSKDEIIELIRRDWKGTDQYIEFIDQYGNEERLLERLNKLLETDWIDKRIEYLSRAYENQESNSQ